MNVLDLFILLAALGYGITGYRNGAVVGAFSLVGFFLGAVLGVQLAEPLGSRLAEGRAQVPIAIACTLAFALLGQLLGLVLGNRLKSHIVRAKVGRYVDAIVGLLLSVVAVLLVSWMVAVPLASSPYPSLASAASHSEIVRDVDRVLPDGMRHVYSKLRRFLDRSGFPPVFGDLPSAPVVAVAPPDATLSPALRARVRHAAGSTVKIYGSAPQCRRRTEGSGFSYAEHYVMTNAHVVAGAQNVTVQDATGAALDATVVRYDPDRDVAVLYVPGLAAPALRFAARAASSGDPAVVLGYPQDGPFTARAARVRTRATVSGADIYGNGNVEREVYSVRAVVRSGNSGGPLLASDGSVLGVVFATALDSPDTGFVLTAAEVAADARGGRDARAAVATGSCTAG